MIPPGYSWIPSKNISPFALAVWPAIGNMYTNVLFYYIEEDNIFIALQTMEIFEGKIPNIVGNFTNSEIVQFSGGGGGCYKHETGGTRRRLWETIWWSGFTQTRRLLCTR